LQPFTQTSSSCGRLRVVRNGQRSGLNVEIEELLERSELALDWLAEVPDDDAAPEWVDAYEL